MNITQKFFVGDKEFDNLQAAEEYVASIDPAKLRLAAFVEHLRSTGVKRVSKTITETIASFIKFESGEVDPVPATTDVSAANETPASTPEVADNVAEPEEDKSTHKSIFDTSTEIDGPDATLDEDPLAGLDI